MQPNPAFPRKTETHGPRTQLAFLSDNTAFAVGFFAIIAIFGAPLAALYVGLVEVALWYQAFLAAAALIFLVRLAFVPVEIHPDEE